MDTLMRMQASYDIARTRQREGEISIEPDRPSTDSASIPAETGVWVETVSTARPDSAPELVRLGPKSSRGSGRRRSRLEKRQSLGRSPNSSQRHPVCFS